MNRLLKNIVLTVLILCSQFCATKLQQSFNIPTSPCPHIFQYTFDRNNYIGVIELPSPPIQHNEVILHIVLSLRAATTVRVKNYLFTVFNVNTVKCYLMEFSGIEFFLV